jgi:hypothetical protein
MAPKITGNYKLCCRKKSNILKCHLGLSAYTQFSFTCIFRKVTLLKILQVTSKYRFGQLM